MSDVLHISIKRVSFALLKNLPETMKKKKHQAIFIYTL
ncbi:hypothetical protein B4110_0496 [Parageobacillus toebii]|uniref:Uncharacterized protein n=1 Tax=Parageobacillus toebii TaxID=153151 RepID=A0A150N5T2_9BACL|nr:hypothetical protein B4110_0496 [Parageobacillus toebii]